MKMEMIVLLQEAFEYDTLYKPMLQKWYRAFESCRSDGKSSDTYRYFSVSISVDTFL